MNPVIDVLQVEFQPTLKQLASVIGGIGNQLTNSIKGVNRLPLILAKKKSNKEVKNAKFNKLLIIRHFYKKEFFTLFLIFHFLFESHKTQNHSLNTANFI